MKCASVAGEYLKRQITCEVLQIKESLHVFIQPQTAAADFSVNKRSCRKVNLKLIRGIKWSSVEMKHIMAHEGPTPITYT